MEKLVREIEKTTGFVLVAVDQDDTHLFEMAGGTRDGLTIGSVNRINEYHHDVQFGFDLANQAFGWNDTEIQLGNQTFRALLRILVRRLRRQPQGTLEHTRPSVPLRAQPAKQTDPLTSLQLEPVQAVLGHLRRGTPGELRLASNGKRVDEELQVALQQVGQRQHLIRLQGALAVFDVRDRLTVVQAHALGELILRPAFGLARRFDAVADQLLRDLFEHGSHLLNLHSNLAK